MFFQNLDYRLFGGYGINSISCHSTNLGVASTAHKVFPDKFTCSCYCFTPKLLHNCLTFYTYHGIFKATFVELYRAVVNLN